MDPGTSASSVLNLETLDEVTAGDLELIRELAELYVTDVEGQLVTLADAVAAQDLAKIGRIAHGLKGSSASLGAVEAAGAFGVLEEKGHHKDETGLGEALATAQAAFARAREALIAL